MKLAKPIPKLLITLGLMLIPYLALPSVSAVQNPQSGSIGLEGTVPSAPPTEAATIAVPSNGQVFTSTPITVSGLCKTGLLVKVFSNNVFVGSANCTNGSYSLKVDLFSGTNALVARVFDNLDQQGPDSNTVTVTFNDGQFAQFGSRVTLTSNYARLGVDPGVTLSWPIVISGGTGPYALSVDWGDGSSASLQSISFPGVVNVTHVYAQAGIFTVVAKASDANGTSAYLQLVGVANGKISGGLSNGSTSGSPTTRILWEPLVAVLPLLLVTFWLGQRYELYSIRRNLEASRNDLS